YDISKRKPDRLRLVTLPIRTGSHENSDKSPAIAWFGIRRGGRPRGAVRALGLGRSLFPLGLLGEVVAAELLGELFEPAGGIDELLLAGEKRVAIRADFHL